MLVVVVIVGILAAALIPRISSAKDRAENAWAIKDVSDIVTALEIYKWDNGDMYPVSASCNGTVKTECSLSWVYNSLSKYLKSIPQGNTKLPQWTIGNGNIVPAWTAYGYIGTWKRYILSYRFTDTRDGQRYKAVRMPDERRWMAENLNFKTPTGSLCYNDLNDQVSCNNGYGRLYDYVAAQTACPPGWKLPTSNEWATMLNAVEKLEWGLANHETGGGSKAGSALKANTWSQNGLDIYGFSVLFAGEYVDVFRNLSVVASFRSSEISWSTRMFSSSTSVSRTDYGSPRWLSIRCFQ